MRSLKNELNAMQAIPKGLVLERGVSYDARFLYVYMACKEEGWKPNVKTLAKEIDYRVEDLLKMLGELVESGWMSVTKYDEDDFEYVLNIVQHNNIIDNNIVEEKKKERVNTLEKKDKDLFEQCWVAYRRKGNKKKALEQWVKLKSEERARVMAHVKAYVSAKELSYQRDFERYLRDKVFLDIISKGNNVIYDPSKQEDGDFYNPMIDGFIQWSEEYKCHIYLGVYWEGMEITDGYTDETRPDGARMMLNNARGKLRWSREKKQWERQF